MVMLERTGTAARTRGRAAPADDFATRLPDITRRYLQLLSATGNPLADDPTARPQLLEELGEVIAATVRELSPGPGPTTSSGAMSTDESAAPGLPCESVSVGIGTERARAGIHPSYSLWAAGRIFDAAFADLVTWYAAAQPAAPDPAIRVGTVLSRTIMDHTATASSSYVDHLLGSVQSINADLRRRVSGQLHDVVAASIAAALAKVETCDAYVEDRHERARSALGSACETLRDALDTVRLAAAQEHGSSSTDTGLAARLAKLVDRMVPDEIAAELTVDGPLDDVPQTYREELFLIVREAVRNAIEHSGCTRLGVVVRGTADLVSARVEDDGRGFDAADAPSDVRSIGLKSMCDRAVLLGGHLTITSRPGHGTRVSLVLPLPLVPASSGS